MLSCYKIQHVYLVCMSSKVYSLQFPLPTDHHHKKLYIFPINGFLQNGLPKIPTLKAVPLWSHHRCFTKLPNVAVPPWALSLNVSRLPLVAPLHDATHLADLEGFFSHGPKQPCNCGAQKGRILLMIHFLGFNPPKKNGFFGEQQTFRQCASNSRFQIQGRLTCHSAATFQCSLLTCKCLFQAYQFLAVDSENGGQELDIFPKLVVFQSFPMTGVSFNCETTLLLQLIGSHLCLFG